MPKLSITLIVPIRTRTIIYIQPNLYKIKECNTYISCQGDWVKETTVISYDSLCALLEQRFFVMV